MEMWTGLLLYYFSIWRWSRLKDECMGKIFLWVFWFIFIFLFHALDHTWVTYQHLTCSFYCMFFGFLFWKFLLFFHYFSLVRCNVGLDLYPQKILYHHTRSVYALSLSNLVFYRNEFLIILNINVCLCSVTGISTV